VLTAKRFAAVTLTTILGMGSIAAPTLAATSSHWSRSQCQAYAHKYTHASKSKKVTYNRVLKSHHCTVTIK
jgi:hypothetical protein